LVDDVIHGAGRRAVIEAVRAREVVEIFPDRQRFVHREKVRQIADVLLRALRLRVHVDARHDRLAVGRFEEPARHPDHRRLSGAVGADEAVDLSARDDEIHIVDGDEVVELFPDPGEADHMASSPYRQSGVAT
jgi:hypothetical protein